MVPNMKFYVISIVAIFAALGIGIYIGFTLDAQSFVVDQREDIALKLEERFDYQKEENEKLKLEISELESNKAIDEEYIDKTYKALVENKLEGKNILVLETNSDYMYSAIGDSLEDAGGNVLGVITIRDNIFDEESLNLFYEANKLEKTVKDLTSDLSQKISQAILSKDNEFLKKLKDNGFIDLIGSIDGNLDVLIVAGGSIDKNNESISRVDKNIINFSVENNLNVVGVEKSNVKYSYIDAYKNSKITTVDNIETVMGKVSLIYAIDKRPGNYGIKETADSLMPIIDKKLEE